ncbi:MAG: hypothetical protein RMJ53_10450 [Chitinophagales bacterium]|nr:hypothetical protein [Chitinophagales bacterium]MDW8274637.1 hypothetical protein [Chitinophagales bacterium]
MIAHNFPESFKLHIKQLLGTEETLFFQAHEQTAPVSVRLNPEKNYTQWLQEKTVPWCNMGRYLTARPLFTADPLFHAGCYYVQEASSMSIEIFIKENIDLNKPITALDLCAAPGGKSTHLLSLLHRDSSLFCNEVIPKRNQILCENIIKWGKCNVIVTQNSAKDFSHLENFFDLVIVDAPCSGEGLFRKDPASISEWSEKNVERCALRQRAILEEIIHAIKPGGILIYSTCTYQRCENEMHIEWLCQSKGFKEIKIKSSLPAGLLQSDYGYRFYPHKIEGEGFYIACLRKEFSLERKRDFPTAFFLPGKESIKPVKTKELVQDLIQLIQCEGGLSWLIFKDNYICIPELVWQRVASVVPLLNIQLLGTAVASAPNNQLVHPAALSVYLSRHVKTLALDKAEALEYLKGQAMHKQLDKGWYLATYEGAALGWIKSVGNRLNNLYPKHWKIRMNIPMN